MAQPMIHYKTKAENALLDLLNYSKNNDYSGMDPYDIVEKSKFIQNVYKPKNEQSFIDKLGYFIYHNTKEIAPSFIRKALKIETKVHPTAMAGFMVAYLNLYKKSNNKEFLSEANYCRDWLISNRITDYTEYCWGTPFEWKSGDTLYKKSTPFSVVCVWVGQAFLESYRITKNEEDLEILKSICQFLIKYIPRSEYNNTICFSYSPVKKDLINNANLFVASLLSELYNITKEPQLHQLIIESTNYSINQQQDDGLIPYYGKQSTDFQIFNDSYHSSYEIRSLLTIHQNCDYKPAKASAFKYYDYVKSTYFNNSGAITLSKGKQNIVDATSIAEYLILLSLFPELDEPSRIKQILNYSLDNFQDKAGFFYYRKTNNKTIKTPYIRWVQGWMAWGLSKMLTS